MISDGLMSSESNGGSVANMLKYQDKQWAAGSFNKKGSFAKEMRNGRNSCTHTPDKARGSWIVLNLEREAFVNKVRLLNR
jgi:hypothetical protein